MDSSQSDTIFVDRQIDFGHYLRANIGREVTINELAGRAGVSIGHFITTFRQRYGISPYRYLTASRIREAQRLLRETSCSVADIALEVGFCDQSHFTRTFRQLVGQPPARWRKS